MSAFALRLQDLLSKAMPGLKGTVLSTILKGQLSNHLPDYMKALVTFNQDKSWDELLTALDASHPYASKLTTSCSFSENGNGLAMVKSEPLDLNAMSTSFREERRCHSCNEIGYI